MIKRLGKFWESIRDKKEVASVRRGMMKLAVGVAVGICCVGVGSGNVNAAYSSTTYGVHNISNPTYSSSGTPYNYIYFGKVPSGNSNYDSSAQGKEIYWRVLNTTSNNGSTPALFVLTERAIGTKAWDEESSKMGQLWSYSNSNYASVCSTVRGFLNGSSAGGIDTYAGNGMYQNCFTEKERTAILNTVKSSETLGYYGHSQNPSTTTTSESAAGVTKWQYLESLNQFTTVNGSPLEGDYIFLLSAIETVTVSYGFKSLAVDGYVTYDINRLCRFGDSGGITNWWLRSAGRNNQYSVAVVTDSGKGETWGSTASLALRPALNIKLSSVILTYPASVASSSSTLSSLASNAPSAAAGSKESASNASRLTIYDSSRNSFSVSPSSISQKAGNGIVIKYSGMPTTGSDYVSVLLFNSNKSVVYYGRLKSVGTSSGSGVAAMTVPSISTGTYTLRVLNEYQETDRVTSYAGYKDIILNVTTIENSSAAGGTTNSPTVTNVYKNSDGTYYKLTASDSDGLSIITGTNIVELKDISSLGTSGTCNVATTSGTTALKVYDSMGNYTDINSNILTDSTGPVIDEVTYENGQYVISVTDTESGIWKIVGNKSDSTTTTFADYST